jgi:ubiquinone/menaquinone biosynthesis C-methylase UbiE
LSAWQKSIRQTAVKKNNNSLLSGIQTLLIVLLLLPAAFLLLHTFVRILRHFHKFPMPSFLADAIDNPLRRRLITPPDRTALRHGIRPGMTVLEVGPGNGRYTVAAARRVGETGKIFAVDIEPDMVTRVKKRAEKEGITNIDAVVADAYALPFRSEVFDLITMTAVSGEIPDLSKAMLQFRRMLPPNGLLVFSELLMDPDYPAPSRLIRLAAAYGFRLKRRLGSFIYYTLHFEKSLEAVSPPISPVNRSHHSARINYDRISAVYDLAASSEWPITERGLQLFGTGVGYNWLEIGCGTGRALAYIASHVDSTGRIIGLDISKGMLDQAQKRIYGLDKRLISLNLGNALKLPYADCSFDRLFLSFTLETFDFPEIPLVLAECCRVLRSGGRIAVVSLAKKDSDPLPVRFYEWVHRILPVLVDCRPIYAPLILQKAGFILLQHEEKISWGLPVDITLAQKPEAIKE